MGESQKPQVLQAALDFEEKGEHFYKQAATTAREPLTQTLFKTLAEDENKHAQRIQEIFRALGQAGNWPALSPTAPHLEAEIRKFFEKHRQTPSPAAEQLEIYQLAMDMEKAGIELYTRMQKESQLLVEKEFFQALRQEEIGHLSALQNVYFFLTQSGDWFQEDESHRWNWMNL